MTTEDLDTTRRGTKGAGDARREARRERKARRHAFWTELGDRLLSMPTGVAMRLG